MKEIFRDFDIITIYYAKLLELPLWDVRNFKEVFGWVWDSRPTEGARKSEPRLE